MKSLIFKRCVWNPFYVDLGIGKTRSQISDIFFLILYKFFSFFYSEISALLLRLQSVISLFFFFFFFIDIQVTTQMLIHLSGPMLYNNKFSFSTEDWSLKIVIDNSNWNLLLLSSSLRTSNPKSDKWEDPFNDFCYKFLIIIPFYQNLLLPQWKVKNYN